MILVLSFLLKGESFSFVKGFWFLEMTNRKTFLVDILGSPLYLMFLDGDWKVFCFLAFGKLLQDLYFFGNLCLVYRRVTSALMFLQGDLNSLDLSSFFYQGVFISVIAIYDFFLLFFCSILFFSHDAANLIWLTFVV